MTIKNERTSKFGCCYLLALVEKETCNKYGGYMQSTVDNTEELWEGKQNTVDGR